MKRFFICVCLSGFALAAAEPPQLIRALRAEYATEMKVRANERGQIGTAPLPSLPSGLPLDGEELEDTQLPEVLRGLKEIQAASQSQTVQGLCELIATELQEKSSKKIAQFQEDFKTAVQHALTEAFDGTSSKDVDAPLASLARLSRETAQQGYVVGGVRTSCSTIVESAEMILFVWQNALISSEDPDALSPRDFGFPSHPSSDSLRDTAAYYRTKMADIMAPELTAKVGAAVQRLVRIQHTPLSHGELEKKSADIINGVKELKDMGAALAQIDAMIWQQRKWEGSTTESQAAVTFRKYNDIYNCLHVGLSCDLPLEEGNSSTDTREALMNLRKFLIRLALPRLLGTPPGLSPNEDESTSDFLRRARSTAVARSDWTLLTQVLKIADFLGFSEIAIPNDEEALRHFLSGVNLEQAHLPGEAVISYLTALKLGPRSMPVDYIQAHLQAIQKQSPADYDAARSKFNSAINFIEPMSQRFPATHYATSLKVPDAPWKPAAAQNR